MFRPDTLIERIETTVVSATPPDRLNPHVMRHLGNHVNTVNSVLRVTGMHVYVFHAGLRYVVTSIEGGGLIAWVGRGGMDADRPGGLRDLRHLLTHLGFTKDPVGHAVNAADFRARVSALLAQVGTALHVAGRQPLKEWPIDIVIGGACMWRSTTARPHTLLIDRHGSLPEVG